MREIRASRAARRIGVATRALVTAALLAPVGIVVFEPGADALPGSPARASVATDGTQANAASARVAVSADGLHVAFTSDATNLVAGDTNSHRDVFVRNLVTNATVRVSVASNGTQAAEPTSYDTRPLSDDASISADGRYVAFQSQATNLVGGDGTFGRDVYVHDRDTDNDQIFDEAGAVSTTRVSVWTGGAQAEGDALRPKISADGRYVAFDHNGLLDPNKSNVNPVTLESYQDAYVRDRDAATTSRVSFADDEAEGNEDSRFGRVSNDGRYVVFQSRASNLVAGDGNGTWDVFLRDRTLGTTTRVSRDTGGGDPNGESIEADISADGSTVVFESAASDLVAGDGNGARDAFRWLRAGATMSLASVATDGTQGNSASENATVSSDGRYVAFESASTNLVTGDSNGARDVFVRDTQAPETFRASVDSGGAQGNGASTLPAIGNDGDDVAFLSAATNLVAGDTNGVTDAFVIDVDVPPPTTTSSSTTTPTTAPPTTTTTAAPPPPTTTTTTTPATTTTSTSTTTTTVAPTTTTTTGPATTTTSTPRPTSTTTTGPVTLPTLPVTPTVPGSEPERGGSETEEQKSSPPLVQIELAGGQRSDPGAGDSGEHARTAPNGAESRWVRMSAKLMVLLGGLGIAGLVGGLFAMGLLVTGGGLLLFPFWRRRNHGEADQTEEADEGSEASAP